MEKGLIHLYWGDGKGKTTAAMGVAMRGLAAGKKVVIVQFLKGAPSGEIPLLQQLGAVIYRGKAGDKFVFQMTEEEKSQTRKIQNEHLQMALSEKADMLILDEVCAAITCGFLEEERVLSFLQNKPDTLEVVMTGRDPSERLQAEADYISEICKRKHPFDRGIAAREGIEQ